MTYNIAFLRHGNKYIGGGPYSEFLLAKNLSKNKFKPILLYAHYNQLVDLYNKEGIETLQIPLSSTITSVYRERISYNPFTLLRYSWQLIVGIIRTKKVIKNKNIDLLVPCDNLSKIIGSIAAKMSGAKVVAHCRDELLNNFISKVLRFFYLNFCDKVIAVSDKTGEFLRIDHREGKIITIYNGVDTSLFNPDRAKSLKEELRIEDDKIVIGIIAVLLKYKGHAYLFKTVEKLKSMGINNLMYLVVGEGELMNKLKESVKLKNISDSFLFLGFRDDIPDLLKTMDILIIPSIEQEAFPRVAIEAMSMKVPVIATTVGGLPEAIDNGKTGILVSPKDVDSLTGAIKYLIENPEIRKEMGEAGRKRVEKNFSIEKNVKRTEELYIDVLKNSKR